MGGFIYLNPRPHFARLSTIIRPTGTGKHPFQALSTHRARNVRAQHELNNLIYLTYARPSQAIVADGPIVPAAWPRAEKLADRTEFKSASLASPRMLDGETGRGTRFPSCSLGDDRRVHWCVELRINVIVDAASIARSLWERDRQWHWTPYQTIQVLG